MSQLGLAKPLGGDASSRLSDSGTLLSTESERHSSGSSASSHLGSPPVFVSTRFSDSDSTGHSEHSESLTMLSRMRSLSMSSSSSTESALSDPTETEPIKEVPQTLTACKKLLEKGHVNLVDYLDVCRPLRTQAEFSELRGLVFSSAAEMMRCVGRILSGCSALIHRQVHSQGAQVYSSSTRQTRGSSASAQNFQSSQAVMRIVCE